MSKWQPIETAPKDGTEILIYDGRMRCVVKWSIWFDGHKGDWTYLGASGYEWERSFYEPVVYWMPLPDKPNLIAEKVAAIINAESDVFIKARDAATKVWIRWTKKL